MGLMDQLFGTEMPLAVKFLLAFAIVLGLIYATATVVRRLAGRKLPLSNSGRARQPRLGVLDAFAIDARRRLVLIRRDNVEHLIMIGGPNDVVVESHIVRTPAQAGLAPQRGNRPPAEAVRAPVVQPQPQAVLPPQPATIPPQPRIPAPSGLQPAPAPTPFPPRQPNLAAVPPAPPAPAPLQDVPPPVAPAAEPQRSKPGFFRSTMNRATSALATPADSNPPRGEPPIGDLPPEPREPATPRIVPTPLAAAPNPPPAPASGKPKAEIDPLFADIERQLEEALQRPKGAATPAEPAPKLTPSPRRPAERPAAPAPRLPEPAPATDTAAADKSHLDTLEEEMANLLGRSRPS